MPEGLGGSKRVLVVLFVPSVERDGKTEIDQGKWVEAALENLGRLGAFCRKMGRETNQGEIGLVIGDEYLATQDYTEDEP